MIVRFYIQDREDVAEMDAFLDFMLQTGEKCEVTVPIRDKLILFPKPAHDVYDPNLHGAEP